LEVNDGVRIQLDWPGEKLATRLADLESGRITPAMPRDAATVMVLRRGPDTVALSAVGRDSALGGYGGSSPREVSLDGGPDTVALSAIGRDIQVLMLRRTAAMRFAPGAYVFPGGSVDPADYNADIGWHGPSPSEVGARLGASAEVARALVCAAVRETFEEAGVLLAGAPAGGPLAAPSGPSWDADRMAVVSGTLTLAELLNKRGLVLRADLLVPWARWITPEGEPRRFDARFFTAALPYGQEATGHEAEADHVTWLRPAEAIEAAKAGTMSLLPPTATTLNEFKSAGAAGQGLADILATHREIEPVQPRLVLEDGTAWLVLPEGVDYPR
jgi:8-oxo-dGTP pyrophosphatase MutT (NUDIX family)